MSSGLRPSKICWGEGGIKILCKLYVFLIMLVICTVEKFGPLF
jgi:hypothetical protein